MNKKKEIMSTKIAVATLIVLTSVRLIYALEYRSKMLNQRISYFENSYIRFDVKYYGDEGYPYLTLLDDITPYNDLHLMVYAKKSDKELILLSHSPISVCQLLNDVNVVKNQEFLSSPMAQFNLPQIFNFNGKVCPIEQSTIRLSPYIFPSNFTFDNSLGCGFKNIESRLMKCSEEISEGLRDCETLLKNVVYAYVENDSCQTDPQKAGFPSENNWIFNKVVDMMKMF